MWYSALMKKILFVLMMAVGLCMPVHAESHSKTLRKQVTRGLVNAVQKSLEERSLDTDAEQDAESRGKGKGALISLVTETIAPQISAVKEHYKEEGRAYVRELGDLVAERILASPKVQRVLTLLEIVAGALAAYLTLVTIKLLCSVRAIRKNTERLLKLHGARRGNS